MNISFSIKQEQELNLGSEPTALKAIKSIELVLDSINPNIEFAHARRSDLPQLGPQY